MIGFAHGCRLAGLALLLVAVSVSAGEVSLEALAARLAIDRGTISVSGLSSGGFMAQQFHVIHSRSVRGAGIIAGGPYACATGTYPPFSWFDRTGLYAATSRCSNTNPWWFWGGAPELSFSLRATRREARAGNIDDPPGMRGDRVWLLSGSEDETVPRAVVTVLENYYLHFVDEDDVHHERLAGAGHAMITTGVGNACEASAPPFVNDCGFDAAGRLLEHVYGPLRARVTPASPDALLEFDQTAHFDAGDRSVSLHRKGHVYVPERCVQGDTCRLHVAFHGCRQHQDLVGDAFYGGAGYNEWAEGNAIVVLYPQATAWSGDVLRARANPRGCWDWWGYGGEHYLRRSGKQVRAVASMINALLGESLLPVPQR